MKTFKAFIKENESAVSLEKILQLYGRDLKKFDLDYLYAHLGLDEQEIPRDQLAKGIAIELEHIDVTGGDPIETAKIAIAHIKERKDYYDKLEKYVEKE